MRKIYRIFFLIASINACGQIPNTLTKPEKVFGLSKFWQEVNYNFVYLNKMDRNKWDSAYLTMIEQVQQTQNDYEYYRHLKRFCALLKDGHTNIEYPNVVQSELMRTMFGEFRLYIENIQGKAIVTHINPSKKEIIPPGSEIVEVNGLATRVFMNKMVTPYVSASTTHVLEDIAMKELLQGLAGDRFNIKIKKPNGELVEVSLVHSRSAEIELYPALPKDEGLIELKWLESRIAYVALNSFQDPIIDSLFESYLPALYRAQALIIDLRKNGGGNGQYGLDILKYLIPEKEVIGAKSQTRQNISAYKAWGELVQPSDTLGNAEYRKAYLNFTDGYYFEFPNSPRPTITTQKKIVVPTVLLIGHRTASAAEDFLIYANGQKHFTTVGAPTFGSTGQPFYFTLPGGGQARVCTKRDTYPDGKEFVGIGIIPEVHIVRTVADFINERDPELEKAIVLLNHKINK